MQRMCFLGHIGNIYKQDDELVHVSPTRSRELAKAFAEVGFDVTAGVYWPQTEKALSDNLRYVHIDKLEPEKYDIVFCHLILSIQQLVDLAQGESITRGEQIYGKDRHIFQQLINHPCKYLQLDAPRPLSKDKGLNIGLATNIKCVGVATQNAVAKWKKMYPYSNVEWVNAATIAHQYPVGLSPYPESNRKRVIYLGRMNDASHITPLEKLHHIAALLPDVEFHLVTNKVRDGKTSTVHAINDLQTGSGREIRFGRAEKLIRAENIFLHRGSKYSDSFNWMHHADVAVGFAVRKDQDVASCKGWEYFGSGIPSVIEEGTPETWILDKVSCGEVARYGDWQDFADKIKLVLNNPKKYKRRKTREYIANNHTYLHRARQWKKLMEKYQ